MGYRDRTENRRRRQLITMAFLKIDNVRIAGISAAVPKGKKDIRSLSFFAPGEAEKVIALTHVEESRIAPDGMCCSDLCFTAAERLISSMQWDKSEIDALIFVSLSRDYIAPATANILQERLGLSTECLAFDIPLACSGYVYGLSVIASLMSTGGIRKALLLVGETTSRMQSPLDKTLWPIHGDAGTATAIEYNPQADTMFFHLCSDGSRASAIMNQYGGTRFPMTEESLEIKEREPGPVIRNGLHAYMDGLGVFSFSIKEPPSCIKGLCEHYDLSLEDIDYLLLHQANKYMDDKIGRKLKVPDNKIPFSLMKFGNTSSASIPMTIVVALSEIIPNQNASIIMCGFGAGLSWGAAQVNLDHITCLPLIEI